MKTKLKLMIAMYIIAAGALITSTSCEKEDEGSGNQNNTESDTLILNEQSGVEAVYSSDIFTGVITDVLVNSDKYDSKGAAPKGCPSVSLVPTTGYPKTLTIDYGSGCTHGGRTMKGVITATLSNKIWKKGTTVAVVFTNFAIDTIGIDGGISMTIDSINHQHQRVYIQGSLNAFKLSMSSGTLTTGGNMELNWQRDTASGNHDDTVNITTAVFSATSISNTAYSITLIDPLVYPASCGHIVSGTVEVQEAGAAYPATLDFGSGSCDKLVEICTTKAITIGSQTVYQSHCFDVSIP